MMRLILSLLFLLTAAAGNSFAQSISNTQTCSRVAIESIHFSSFETPDQLIVQVIGDECDEPLLAVTISTATGGVVYSHAFPALYATYDCGSVADCVDWAFDGAVGMENGMNGGDLPPLEEALLDDVYFEVNEPAYRFAQENDRPLFCYQAGKSFGYCVVFMDGAAIHTHGSGT